MNHSDRSPGALVGAVMLAALALPALTASAAEGLTQGDVETLVARSYAAAGLLGRKATIVVTDREANVLAAYAMPGANARAVLSGGGRAGQGLEGASVPALFAAISKAGTGAFFATRGNAFTTRTAGYIVQEHFPPTVERQPGGPLFGVQLSSLPCGDVSIAPGATGGFLPLGLSADPGGLPLYKNGEPVGGLGIEEDGLYSLDRAPLAEGKPESIEERIAILGSLGYSAPEDIRATEILVNGLRLPYVDASEVPPVLITALPPPPPPSGYVVGPRPAQPSRLGALTLGGVTGTVLVDPGTSTVRFPTRTSASGGLSAADVNRILTQAAQTAAGTRAAIRQPLGSSAEVSIAVVDEKGALLGFFRTADAPLFGMDVSAQKARAAAFFSAPGAGATLAAAGFASYGSAAAADGVPLDGTVAFSDRGLGFLSRPFFPDGIDGNPPGPFSRRMEDWSVFNTGLQADLVAPELLRLVSAFDASGVVDNSRPCTSVPGLANGLQIFAGSVPLYANGVLVGAVGVSGDGIDQDDFIAAGASAGFESPKARRTDRLLVRGVRLPFVKFPRHPKL